MDFNNYIKIDINNNASFNAFHCTICLECTESDLFELECNHVFHKNCIMKHIETKIINKSSKITCPIEKCPIEISKSIINRLIDNKLFIEYIKMLIDYDENYCVCYKCKNTFTKKNIDGFIGFCYQCNTTHCFQCGKFHASNINCFEASDEKVLIDNFYKNKGITIKQCPHCFLPQEKLTGCNIMTCGTNTEDSNLRLQGCGKKFNWLEAKIYNAHNNNNNFIGNNNQNNNQNNNSNVFNRNINNNGRIGIYELNRACDEVNRAHAELQHNNNQINKDEFWRVNREFWRIYD